MKASILAATLALALGATLSTAQAQSSEYNQTTYRSHPYGTTHSLNTGGGYGDYAATATPDSYGESAPVAASRRIAPEAAPDYGRLDPVPQYFDHAMGTMGTRGGQ